MPSSGGLNLPTSPAEITADAAPLPARDGVPSGVPLADGAGDRETGAVSIDGGAHAEMPTESAKKSKKPAYQLFALAGSCP